ncbi:gas vesicle structural protein GvpA [Streptomyces sp. NBC_01803]|uniref:gas vesicle structural protein GvpA n=1 Tax=Streptomyces sp. NBC_01803 TaxID=2975946 RepID=UPI002DD94C06|nr:gas vesicle structural protein GvpA [Streptomyces sp. NBC_01803]WSA46940.1 gas vesicle structural protein GvpA [Streptomyces sp. NBC_01803]
MTTAVAPIQQTSGSRSGTLYDVLELILDRGLVIDAFVRVSLVGIEILKIDVRVVVASVDTYLRFAEACNRLDLEAGPAKDPGVPELVGGLTENGARGKTKGALSGAAETISDAFKKGRDGLTPSSSDGEEEAKEAEPRKTRRTTTSRRERESE